MPNAYATAGLYFLDAFSALKHFYYSWRTIHFDQVIDEETDDRWCRLYHFLFSSCDSVVRPSRFRA